MKSIPVVLLWGQRHGCRFFNPKILPILLFFALCISSGLTAQPLPWSDPATWGGTKPVAGDEVVIPDTLHILLDEDTPGLGSLTINGILEFDTQDLNLTSDWILVQGELWIGSDTIPYAHQATITLTSTDTSENIMGLGTRGILVRGGRLEMHGTPPAVPWTKINAHAPAGSTSLTLMENVGWQVGDQVVIAPTDYYNAGNGASITQRATLTQVDTSQLTIGDPLNAHRWGLLQYATNDGMSLVDSNLVSPPADSGYTPLVLDERAEVGNLTRNIVVRAPSDAAWNDLGFGCHIIIAKSGNSPDSIGMAHINGVEVRRGGQRGRLGRYGFHCHLLSSIITDTLPDAAGQYFRNSVINESMSRGIVLHGTSGFELSNNIIYSTRGHGIFTEDAVERRNVFDGNLVLHVRNPDSGFQLKNHEAGLAQNASRGSSGFWISNPDNITTGNTAADCGTNGFWLTFPPHPWGPHINFPMIPNRIRFGVFENNTAHSNGLEGVMLDWAESDAQGNVFPLQYISTTDGANPSWPWPTIRRFTLGGYKTWKNGAHGIWDRAVTPDNWEIVSADNCGRYFAGSGANGLIARSLVVGTSLNHLMNGTDRPNFTGEVVPAAFATYHSAFDIQDNIAVGFPEVDSTKSGMFATEDYYLRPVEKGQMRNTGNLTVGSHPGVKLMAPYDYFALAGALWDPQGAWGGTAGDWFVYDTPFYTYDQTPTEVPPGAVSGGVLVEGPFYGFNHFVVNLANDRMQDFMEIQTARLDENFDTVGTWTVVEAQPNWALGHMRHFAAHQNGYYTLHFPSIAEVNDIGLTVSNMHTTDDTLLLAIEYSGNYAIGQVYTSSIYNYLSPGHTTAGSYANKHVYTAVDSLQAVIDSPGGETYWHDQANGIVWIKIQGGIEQVWDPGDYPPYSNELLYWEFNLRVWGTPVLQLQMNAFLEGPYNAANGNMRYDLATAALLPTTEPFTDLGFTHLAGGGGEMSSQDTFAANQITDWVFVELRSAVVPDSVLATRSALLQNDGDIVDMDGISPVLFTGQPPGEYYVALRHRNHLGIMTGAALSLGNVPTTIDFTTAATATYGTGARIDLGNGVMGMFAADLDASGTVDAADRSAAWNDRNLTGYQNTDTDLNGVTDAADRSAAWNNRNRVQQLAQ